MIRYLTKLFTNGTNKFKKDVQKEKNRIYLRTRKNGPKRNKKRFHSKKQLQLNISFQRKSIIIFSIFGFVSALIGIIFVFKGPYFSVQNVHIYTYDQLTDTNLAYSSIEQIRGKNIFVLNKNEIEKKLKLYQPNIKDIQINKVLPNAINITIESFPILLGVKYYGRKYGITSNGIAIPHKKVKVANPIPFVTIIDNNDKLRKITSYKELLSPNITKKILYLQSSLSENLLDFSIKDSLLYKKENEYHIFLNNDTRLIFDLHGNISEQIKKIAVFYKETKHLKKIYIDLRIVNKVFYCEYEYEYQCRQNIKKLYPET